LGEISPGRGKVPAGSEDLQKWHLMEMVKGGKVTFPLPVRGERDRVRG
jgi:hypothetical protein